MKDKIRQFIRERNKRLAQREKRRISAKKTFAGMLVKRSLIGLIVFVLVVIAVRQYMIEENAKGLDDRYDKINDLFVNIDEFGGMNDRFVYSISVDKWLNSLDVASKTLASDYQDEYGIFKKDTCYWAIYNLKTDKIIKDFSRQHWVVPGYYKNGKEASPIMFEVADEQAKLCNDLLSRKNVYIRSAYLLNNRLYIASYSDSFSYTKEKVMYFNDNGLNEYKGLLEIYMLQNGARYIEFDELCHDEDNFFRESGLSVGYDNDYTIALSHPECISERNVSKRFMDEGYNWLVDINRKNKKDNATVIKHKFGFLSETIIYGTVVSSSENGRYGMVWSVVNEIDSSQFFMYCSLALLVIVALTLIVTSIAYRKYKISHEIYMYRKALTNAMAHDLKSPLAAISGYAENMNAGSNPEKNDYYAEQIMNRTEYMNELIEKLLELSKTDELAVRSQDELEMVSTAEKLFASFSDQMEKRSISYNIEGSSVVMCDEVSMYTAIKNIIENAVKYCDDKGTISVSLSDDKLVFSNPYDGADNLDADRLVEAYIKGDEARSGAKGNGLGLAIVKNICDAHGFTLNVKAADDTFTVTINL